MLRFENKFADDKLGVRLVGHDAGRRVLFRIEKHIALKGLAIQPIFFAMKVTRTKALKDIRRACRRAYLEAPRLDNLTIIKIELRHFGNC
jgi:hypothetical protein